MRQAKLLGCRFVETGFKVTVAAQAWCERDGGEILVIALADGRCFGIHAGENKVFSVTRSSDTSFLPSKSWLLGLHGLQEFPGLGRADFGSPGGSRKHWEASHLGPQVEDLAIHAEVTEHAHGDVEVLALRVTDQRTRQDKLSLRLTDTSGLSSMSTLYRPAASTVERLLALSNRGEMAATIRGKINEPSQGFIERAGLKIGLAGFEQPTPSDGAPDVDQRGRNSSFSPRDSFFAVHSTANSVDIWETDTGAGVLRVRFHTDATGAKTDRAIGLPEEIVEMVRAKNEGWTIELPRSKPRKRSRSIARPSSARQV